MSDVLTPDLIAFIKQQKDRQDILDCLLRYTRGADRHDHALMESAYHPDAWDEHGVAEGNPKDFVNWALTWHAENQLKHQHIVSNHTIELDGDTAHVETYYVFWGENREGRPQISFGRYVDRFEKRDGVWAIAHRVCVNEYTGNFDGVEIPADAPVLSTGPNRRDKTDISYRRPLTRSN